MIDTSVNLRDKSVEEFEELLTKLNQEFMYREAALKLRERQDNTDKYYYGQIYREDVIDENCLNAVHNLIIEYVNK